MMGECNFDPDGGCTAEATVTFDVVYSGIEADSNEKPFTYRLCPEHEKAVRADITSDPNWVIKE